MAYSTDDPEVVALLVASYYDVQKLRIEHGNRVAALVRERTFAVEGQAESLLGQETDGLQEIENGLKRRIDMATRDHPVRVGWLDRVRGIGPVLAGGVLASIERRRQRLGRKANGDTLWVTAPELFPNDGVREARYAEQGVVELLDDERRGIACFDTVSKLWAFWGYGLRDRECSMCRGTGKAEDDPGAPDGKCPGCGGSGRATEIQRPRKNERLDYSPFRKTLGWKIGESFVKCGGSFRATYQHERERLARLYPAAYEEDGKPERLTGRRTHSKAHHHAMAKRYAVKRFLALTYTYWREAEGLPTRPPYPIERLGHVTEHRWQEYVDRPEKKRRVRRGGAA